MKILLADDHPMVRVGMKLLLSRMYQSAEIVEARDYGELLQCCQANPGLALILMDRMMPGMASFGGLPTVLALLPDVPIVVMSASEEPSHVRAALSEGASGYVPKSCSEEILEHALRLVLSGGKYIPVALLGVEAPGSTSPAAGRPGGGEPGAPLTERQLQVLELLKRGRTNKQIARELDISVGTVHTHVNAIFKALSATNRTEAVHVAASLGL